MTTRTGEKAEHPEVTLKKQQNRPPLIRETMASMTNLEAPGAFSQFPSCGETCLNLEDLGVHAEQEVVYNASPSVLYEFALRYEKGTTITSTGAMAAYSGLKTGRSPMDKRVVVEPGSKDDVWWGPVNFPQEEADYMYNRERAIDYLNLQDRIYVLDAFAGWDHQHRMKVRIVCSRAYHALFMTNMLVRATEEELRTFGKPDFTVYNAGCFPANRAVKGLSSSTSVSLNLKRHEMTILGTQYAGEMKKGILTVMMYYMPKRGMLPLHSSANEGKDGKTTLFFGLSGTGKTTLSADPHRYLIGDDEHVWHNKGIFNIEGGCYAKCIGLTREQEPEVYDAIKYGAVVENVVLNDAHEIQYFDKTITENTRCSYPLEHIPNAKLPAIGGHPTNVVLLTCDAFGVLPPISKLTPEQCMYQFISGYTAKVAGTEMGVKDPTPSFSPCFGGPFLVWHPCKYAEMLADKLKQTGAQAWLVNTGWTGGKYGKGSRMKLRYTRCLIDAINNHKLDNAEFEMMPGFGVAIPKHVDGVPDDMLRPWKTWDNLDEYKMTLNRLTEMFQTNFRKFSDRASPDLLKAQPEKWQSKL